MGTCRFSETNGTYRAKLEKVCAVVRELRHQFIRLCEDSWRAACKM